MDGEMYSPDYVNKVWATLNMLLEKVDELEDDKARLQRELHQHTFEKEKEKYFITKPEEAEGLIHTTTAKLGEARKYPDNEDRLSTDDILENENNSSHTETQRQQSRETLREIQEKLDLIQNQTSQRRAEDSEADEDRLLQEEFDLIRSCVIKLFNKYDQQHEYLMQYKEKVNFKLCTLRENVKRERSDHNDELVKLQQQLVLLKADLTNKRQTCKEFEENKRQLQEQQRQLHEQIAEKETSLQDSSNELTALKFRVDFLKKENSSLQDEVRKLSDEKHQLEKESIKYRVEADNELYKMLSASKRLSGRAMQSDNEDSRLLDALISPRKELRITPAATDII